MAFPASALEISDLGARVRVNLASGAVVEDTLCGLGVYRSPSGKLSIRIGLENFGAEEMLKVDPETSMIEYLTGE